MPKLVLIFSNVSVHNCSCVCLIPLWSITAKLHEFVLIMSEWIFIGWAKPVEKDAQNKILLLWKHKGKTLGSCESTHRSCYSGRRKCLSVHCGEPVWRVRQCCHLLRLFNREKPQPASTPQGCQTRRRSLVWCCIVCSPWVKKCTFREDVSLHCTLYIKSRVSVQLN